MKRRIFKLVSNILHFTSSYLFVPFLVFASFIGGIVIALICENFLSYSIVKEVDLVDLFSIISTFFIAVVVTIFLEKRQSDFRVEKDLAIDKISEVITQTKQMKKKILASPPLQLIDVNRDIKNLHTSRRSLYTFIDKCDFNINKEDERILYEYISDLKDLLTNTPIDTDQSVDEPLQIRQGRIHMTPPRRQSVDNTLQNIIDSLRELQLSVNRK